MDGKVTEVIFNTYGGLYLYWTQKWLTIGIHVHVLSKGWVDSGGQIVSQRERVIHVHVS